MNMYSRIEKGDHNVQGIPTDYTNKEARNRKRGSANGCDPMYAMGNHTMDKQEAVMNWP